MVQRRQYLFYAALLAAATLVPRARAQQNLFNVPSAEITRSNEIFFQQQFNVNKVSQSNTTVAYGIGKDYEVGMNFYQLNVIPPGGENPDPVDSLLLLNAQWGMPLNEYYKIGVGTQLGETVSSRRQDVRMANFNYAVGVATLYDETARFYGGAYEADSAYRSDRGDQFGFMAGYDLDTKVERLNLMGDYISGRSGISMAVLGAVWDATANWQWSLGVQLPGPHSGNAYGAVVELTLIPHRGVATVGPQFGPGEVNGNLLR